MRYRGARMKSLAASDYLQSDASLCCYSFTDAWIATQYLSLTLAERARVRAWEKTHHPARSASMGS
jgi:hypothetical protein